MPSRAEPPTLRRAAATRWVRALLAALPQDPTRFAAVAAGVTDWEGVLALAEEEKVARVILAQLQRSPRPPADLVKRAAQVLAAAELRQPRRQAVLDEALAALAEAGLRAAPLKGPWLATRLYPAAHLRPSGDLDLMVAAEELEAAEAALATIGYRPPPPSPEERHYRQHHHHVHLDRRGAPPLELHYHAIRGFGALLRSGPLLERARAETTPGGAPAWTLAPEDEFLYLALHVAGHLFLRLLWLLDLKLLLLRHPGLDWETVGARAQACGGSVALGLCLDLLADWLGLPLAPAAEALRASLFRTGPARALQARLATQAPGRPQRTAGRLAFLGLLAQSPARAGSFWSGQLAGIARRALRRAFPSWTSQVQEA